MAILLFVLLVQYIAALEAGYASSPSSVVIIGAGMSGISAAKTLVDAGFHDFLILEATDRIGGRIRKTEFAGYTVELGANWIQGVGGHKHNPIWKMAKKLKLKSHFTDYNNLTMNIYKQDGGLYPQDVVRAALEAAEASNNFSANLSRSLRSSDDISVLTSQRLFHHIPTSPLEMVIDYYYYDYEDSEPPRVTSLKNTEPRQSDIDFGEDQYFVADQRGYTSVVHYTAKQFLSSSQDGIITDPRLKVNKMVREVNYSKNAVKIQTEDGSVYQAKYALVSVSIGVLQTNLIGFKPDLPPWKILAMYEFDMAIFSKIFLKFPYKFWPTGPGTQYFLYAHERRGYYPIWKHFENEYPGSNILFVVVTDDEARRIEQQIDAETEAEAMEVLRKMFGNDIPKPTGILVPRWWSNRFFKGSFSNWPVGVNQHHFDQLKKPVGPIHFTGEHTNEKYSALVHGAYFAGIDSAKVLLRCLKKGSCETP